jgi:hypothetical protein
MLHTHNIHVHRCIVHTYVCKFSQEPGSTRRQAYRVKLGCDYTSTPLTLDSDYTSKALKSDADHTSKPLWLHCTGDDNVFKLSSMTGRPTVEHDRFRSIEFTHNEFPLLFVHNVQKAYANIDSQHGGSGPGRQMAYPLEHSSIFKVQLQIQMKESKL